MMIRAALRDLQARRRRFFVAIVGAGLVLALGMIMSGLTASFHNEAQRTVELAGADAWVVSSAAAGPFTTPSLLDAAAIDAVRSINGVDEAEPILISRQALITTGDPLFSILIGVQPGRLGAPRPTEGAALSAPGQAVVDNRLGVEVGSTIKVAGQPFVVAGTVRSSLFAATPAVYVSIDEARALGLEGAQLSSAVLVRGELEEVPAGMKSMSPSGAIADAMEPLKSASSTIALVRTLLWLVAALVVGSVLYLNALERTRDMAVFKAVGTGAGSIAVGLAAQAVVVALLAAAVAAGLATLLAPVFPLPVELSPAVYLLLPAVALVVSMIGALGGMHRAVVVPPALAFGAA
ncbi:MAG: ABC transporter permease [Ilumatobacteraceae bacterium]